MARRLIIRATRSRQRCAGFRKCFGARGLALTRLLKPDSLAHQRWWLYQERCAVLAMVGQYDLALLG